MPLHTLDAKFISPTSRANHIYVQAIQRFWSHSPRTLPKMLGILHAALDDTILRHNGKFVYTRSGIELGNGSKIPHADLTYVWEKICLAVTGQPSVVKGTMQEEMLLKGVGAFFQWVVSQRNEFWIVKFSATGKISSISGKEVYLAEYWVDDGRFQKMLGINSTMADLKNKFSAIHA